MMKRNANLSQRLMRPLFGIGVLLGLVAEQVVMFSVPLLIFQDSQKLSVLGIAFALEWLPGLLAYPFVGLIADRDGGRRLFSRVAYIRATVLIITCCTLLCWPSSTTFALMCSGAALSLLMAPTRMAVEKMVPQVSKNGQIASTQSLVQNMELLALALGPALGIFAALVIGKVLLLGVAATVFVIAGLSWIPLPRTPRSRLQAERTSGFSEIRLGWNLLRSNKPVLLLAVFNFSINLAFATLLSMNAAIVTGVFDAPESMFGLLNTAVGIVGFLNLLAIPTLLRAFSVEVLGVFGFVLLVISLLLVGVADSFVFYAILYVAVLTGDAIYNIYNRTQRLRVIPAEHIGKIMGPFYLLNLMSFPIAGVMVATVAPVVGPKELVSGLSVVLIALGLWIFPVIIRKFKTAINDIERREAALENAC